MEELSVGTGTSLLADAPLAGASAAEAALRQLDGQPPALVIVYAGQGYDLPELLAGIRRVTGETPLVGASSGGQLVTGELSPPGEGVAVLVLGGGQYRFGTASVTGLGGDPMAAGQDLARRAQAAAGVTEQRHAALLLLVDALAGNLESLLTGIYRVAGAAVPVVGGAAAASGASITQTFVLHDDQVLTDAAVGVWIDSGWPLQVSQGHGWQGNGLPMLVTRADGTAVYEIGGRPAREVYETAFGPDEFATGDENGPAVGWHTSHAFGLIEPSGELTLRGAYIDETGTLRTFAPLPQYVAVQIMSGDADSLLGVSEQVAKNALAGTPARVLLVFSCVARMQVMRERSGEECALLQQAAGDVPTFGFYTYGEFARTSGVAGYHNATITALAL